MSFGLKHYQSFLPCVALVLLGLSINTVRLPILPGVDLLFGGISVFLIMHRYNAAAAAIAAAIISIPTYFFWSHGFAIFLFAFEALAISCAYKKWHKSLILTVTLFWVFAGIPAVCLWYFGLAKTDLATGIHIGLKDTVNSIFNALIARLIITLAPWIKKQPNAETTPLNRVLFEIIVACITLPIFCVSLTHVHAEYRSEIDKLKTSLAKETAQISHMIETWEKEHLQELSRLALSVTPEAMNAPDGLQERLHHIKETSLYLHGLYVVDANGTVIASNSKGGIGLNLSDRAYFNELKAAKKSIVSSVLTARSNSGIPIVAMTAPILNNNEFNGYISGGLNLNYLRKRLEESSEKAALFTLIGQDGKVIASTNPQLSALDDYKQKRMAGGNPVLLTDIDESNLSSIPKWDTAFYFYQRKISDDIPWTLVAESPLKPIRNYLQEVYSFSFAITILSTLVAFVVANQVSRAVTGPLHHLAAITTHLPDRIASRTAINWPNSQISEIHSLISNYKDTSRVLKENYLRFEYLANHDPLTGLPNRRVFSKFFLAMREDAIANNTKIGIMSFDIDRFKFVNDSLGHAVGDDLLSLAADRLVKLTGTKEKSLRLGGDEFVCLFSGADLNELNTKAALLCGAFREPFVIDGRTFFVSASIGVAVYPDDGCELEQLLRKADIALYRTKELGKNGYQFYSADLGKANDEDHAIETALRTALEENQFSLVYQPQYSLEHNRIAGFEALLRWIHPTLGYISPSKFVPIAEKMGLIRPIGEWVLRTACREIGFWPKLDGPDLRVAVNVSSIQFETTDFADLVEDVLRASNLSPGQLELEITESVAIKNIKHTISMLDSLSRLGVKVALDDFGTGFSSLGYLTKFKIDTLKVDMSFVRELTTNANSRAVVASIISLAKTLSLKVVAEGVETTEQHDMLKALGCDEIQGYFISKPVPIAEIKKLASPSGGHNHA